MKNIVVVTSNEWVASILRLRKEFWDRHGANIVTCYKGTYGERFFWRSKNRFLREIMALSPQFYYTLREICWCEGNLSFCWNYHEICHKKKTEKLLSLRKVYCEIVIAPKYYKVNQESLRNNLFKSFQLYLYMYILFSCLLTYLMNKLRLLKIYLL